MGDRVNNLLCSLMSQLVEMFIGTGRPQEVTFEPVVRAGLEALKVQLYSGLSLICCQLIRRHS